MKTTTQALLAVLVASACVALANYNDGIYYSLSTSYTSITYTANLPSTHPVSSVCSSTSNTAGQWFTFYFYDAGTAVINTCGTAFDTVLEVQTTNYSYTNSLKCVVRNDDDSSACTQYGYSYDSKVTFAAEANRAYYVLLRSFSSSNPSATYTISATLSTGNSCAKTSVITLYAGDTHTYSSTLGTTYAHSVCTTTNYLGKWYSFKPMENGKLHVDTCGSNFDTVLDVEAGSCGSRICVGTHDDDSHAYCPTTSYSAHDSVADIEVDAGKVYDVYVRGYSSSTSSMPFTLHVAFYTGSSSTFEFSTEGVCPSSYNYVSTYGLISGYISSSYDTLPSGCWTNTRGEWWQLSYIYSDYLYVCSTYPVTITVVNDLCESDMPTCGSSYTTIYNLNSWCDEYSYSVPIYAWGADSGTIHVLVSSSYDYVSYQLATSTSFYGTDSSHFNWEFSSGAATIFWIVFPSVCCGLGLCLCMVGLCVCITRCCKRRHAANLAKYAAVPAAPSPVQVTIQTPAMTTATAPVAETTPLTPHAPPPSQPAPPPGDVTPQGPQPQPQLPPPPPGYQYVFLPSPYGLQGQQGAPATAPALYPSVN
eukprot:TRINITY_DN1575_c0_g1_i4.p1 TRINITY_DN1575_c0_g1~~TRINITY_DN1575_c0_g1_i4.p1  ORF type:complete len:590 (+),score=148.79 TRINITY_DN1575_c0_g1_i4:82-1851(+)